VILVTHRYLARVAGVLSGMNSPRVIELPRRLEPVASDPFAERDAADVTPLRPPADTPPSEPQPPSAA
jgi:hypothetical protein